MATNLEFRKIKSLKFLYEISADGRYLRNVKSKRYYRARQDKDGYYVWSIRFEGNSKTVKAHVLVAECWLGDRPAGYDIDHIDRNKTNNHYSNLRYATRKENMDNSNFLHRHNEVLGKKVTWGDREFESYRACARAISDECNLSVDAVRARLKKHYHYIAGKNVTYTV